LINAKRAAIAGPVRSRNQRIARGMAIRRCNGALQSWVEVLRADLVALQARLRAGLRSNRLARNREFASVLPSSPRLRHVLQGVASGRGIGIGSDDSAGSPPG